MFPNQDMFPYSYIGKEHFPGTCFPYVVYSVGETRGPAPCALAVVQDGRNDELVSALEKLHGEGRAPACLVIGIHSGWSTLPDGEYWLARQEEYDAFDPGYGDFLIDEFIPRVISEGGYVVSDDPDMHLIAGGSSGGTCAFAAAWFRPDCFRRLYLSSPSFLSMEKGDEAISLIRKNETRPFRVAMEYSESEPIAYFGDLRQADVCAEKAFEFAGYDFISRYCPGEDHCSRFHNTETLYEILGWLWNDYEKPLAAPRNQPRLDDIVLPGEGWTPCDKMPEQAPEEGEHGSYGVRDGRVTFFPKDGGAVFAEGDYYDLREVALSANKRFIYAADAARGCLRKYVIGPDGVPGTMSRHGMFHIKPDFVRPGAYSICVDDVNRVFAATELGIQCVVFNGLIEAVLDPPVYGAYAEKIAFGGEGFGYLYAQLPDRRVFRRKMKHAGRASVTNLPEDYMKQFVY